MHPAGNMNGRPEWVARRERGSELAMRLLTWLSFALGRRAGRALLYPISLYFLAFSARARRASRAYLTRALGRRASLGDVLRHYHSFASTLHDRLYLAAGRIGEFDVTVRDTPEVRRWLAGERGCILLGSHLGSFEILRALGIAEHARPVNVVMRVDQAAKTSRVLRSVGPQADARVIPLGHPQSLLRVDECLARGEVVGILGDRVWSNDRSVNCDFLGAPARFPLGPWLLAGLVNAPVILFFGLYRGGRRYEIHLEPFAEKIELDRGDREASARPWIQRYAERLERQCRLAPYNWFNFYDYWH
ncbi:MAG TPA: acyl-CoA synthetase [Burkholderiales bacterium]|nr:acyl-CoA synthetase [Burkholderiales bacterium]